MVSVPLATSKYVKNTFSRPNMVNTANKHLLVLPSAWRNWWWVGLQIRNSKEISINSWRGQNHKTLIQSSTDPTETRFVGAGSLLVCRLFHLTFQVSSLGNEENIWRFPSLPIWTPHLATDATAAAVQRSSCILPSSFLQYNSCWFQMNDFFIRFWYNIYVVQQCATK